GVLVFVWAGLPIRIGINWAIARKLLAYGVPLAAGLGVESILEQSDKVIVGRLMGAGVLGFYLLAVSISSWAPGMIGSAIRFVSLPSFARLSEKDENSLSKGVTASLPLLVLAMVPVAVLIAVMATPTIEFLYGAKWLPAAQALRWLMILMVVRMVTGLCMDILMSTGATKWNLLVNLGWLVIAIPALWFGTRAAGAQGAAIAHAGVGVLVAVPLTAVALHRVGVPLKSLGRRMVRSLVAGALAGAVAFLLDRLLLSYSPFVQLAIAGTAGLLAYLLTAIPRDDLRSWVAAIRHRAPASASGVRRDRHLVRAASFGSAKVPIEASWRSRSPAPGSGCPPRRGSFSRFADISMHRNMPPNRVPVSSTRQPARSTMRTREWASK